jgi:hypothetical protein
MTEVCCQGQGTFQPAPGTSVRTDDELVQHLGGRLGTDFFQLVIELDQIVLGHTEDMLIRLKGGAGRIVLASCLLHLDMRTQDVGYFFAVGKGPESRYAGLIRGPILNIKPSGIKRVARKQDTGLRIVIGQMTLFVSGYGNHLDDTTTEVIVDYGFRKSLDTEVATSAGVVSTTVVAVWLANWASPERWSPCA